MFVCLFIDVCLWKLNCETWFMIFRSQRFVYACVRKIKNTKQNSCIETISLINYFKILLLINSNTRLSFIFNVKWICPMMKIMVIFWTVDLEIFHICSLLTEETRRHYSVCNFWCSTKIFPNILQQTSKLLDLPDSVSLG